MRQHIAVAVSCCLGSFLSCFVVTEAAPSIALPFNAQVPPVAFVDQTFQFQFSDSTFASTASTLDYSLSGAPSWVAFDSSTRTLSGSPGQDDVGSAMMKLVASDTTGSIAMPLTLFVSQEQGPELNTSASAQVQTSGTVANSDRVLYYPSSTVLVSFPSDIFVNTNSDTEYYATCANNTPLPSWLIFDKSNFSFSGSPPPFLSPYELPQIYAIRLMATNVPGFYTAQTTFTITVATHQFYFVDINYRILASPGQQVSYEGLQDKLLLDGKPILASDLKSVIAVTPTWLSFDNATLKFSGTAPLNLRPGAVAVMAEDIYGGTANATVSVASGTSPELITKNIGPLQATIGEDFTYELDKDSFTQEGTTTSLDLGEASPWLKYNNTTLVLSGKVPADLTPQTLHFTLTATYDGDSQDQVIALELIRETLNGKPSTTLHRAAPTTQPHPGYNIADDPLRLAAAIIIPIIVVLTLLLLAFCLHKRRSVNTEKHPSKWDRWGSVSSIGILKHQRRRKAQLRAKPPPGVRYSYMDRGPTPQMGLGPAPQIDASALTFRNRPTAQQSSFRPLSDIGQTSRPGSFVRQLASNRWSGQHVHDQSGRCSQCEFSIAEEAPGTSPTDTQALLHNGLMDQGVTRSGTLTRTRPQGRYSGIFGPRPMRSLRQSYTLGMPQDDRPGRRSMHGLGHGRPFPEQDIPSTLREESILSGMWTDTSGSSHAAMNSNSSGGSSIGFPPRARLSKSPTPQMVQQNRPTIRQVGSPPPQSEHAQRDTATLGSRSANRPPSFHSYLEARHDVVRKLREKDSTSFSGYRTSRKSSSGKDTASISVIEEDVPAVPVRLRPALDPQEMVRVSKFYGSQNHSSAQRKGSMIHDRFREPRTESPVIYDLANNSMLGSQWPLPEEPDALPVFVPRRRSKSSTHGDVNRRETLRSLASTADDGRSDLASQTELAMPVPLNLTKRHSWTAGDDEPSPLEEDQKGHSGEEERTEISRESPPADEAVAKRIVIPKRRAVPADPRVVVGTSELPGDRRISIPPQNERVDMENRDASFRFL